MEAKETDSRLYLRNPITIIEGLISSITLVGGIYVLSPVLAVPAHFYTGSIVSQVVVSNLGIFAIGLFAILLSIWNLYAIYKRSYRQRAASTFAMAMLRLYVILATILIVGLFPLSWLSSFTIALILSVCYLYDKSKAREVGGKP